jgi:hypothetical protein
MGELEAELRPGRERLTEELVVVGVGKIRGRERTAEGVIKRMRREGGG